MSFFLSFYIRLERVKRSVNVSNAKVFGGRVVEIERRTISAMACSASGFHSVVKVIFYCARP